MSALASHRTDIIPAGDDDGYLWVLKSTKQPVNGVVCSYDNGKVGIEYFYKNGQESERKHYHYDKSGNVTSENLYKNGTLKLEWRIVREYIDGKLNSETSYNGTDKKEGIERRYYKNGTLFHEIPYKDDKEEGMVKIYYSSGKLLAEIPYNNGKVEEIERWYYENGQLKTETPGKDDKQEGTEKEYSESGKLIRETPYKNGKKRRSWKKV